ncbi:methionyl-tRNA formyltransferase [Ramlibacter tataouinensis]|uniref:Methionyl-tRNA formyltransferase n=1 Tax=Ramlibacter tataouinensis (strain ATCC BAA-407 / DSM 14655 / LMG 21543 / TTB310) TaxID=365046 RepID=F5Y237_RAMTT|nr:methionyl-tRNA formyltransferase [Ramlibacter tataouinensis]AEG94805.1 Candidate methionyl-tRNA formyltransferase [Ramlibacter tataouinensis TTB310]
MRVVFAGTPEFARAALQRLHAAGFDIPLVLTQPDRPAGRGLKLQASPVKQFALDHGLPVAQPRSLRLDGKCPGDAADARTALEAARADVMVVAAYGLILPQWVLDTLSAAGPSQGANAASGGSEPRVAGSVGALGLGCLNIHASLLPRWRGAAPIHRAIEAGDAETGVTIMQMDAGLDTGDMLLAERMPVAPDDTTGSLHDKLAVLGARLIVEALELAACGGLKPVPQPAQGVTYAHKIDKGEAQVDWSQPAEAIARRVRAFDPSPGASGVLNGEAVKLWRAEVDRDAPSPGAAAGTILRADAAGVSVLCGRGVLRITQLQRAGGKRLQAADFLRGFAVAPGMRFDRAPQGAA